jgi:hypothetical protein
MLYPAIRAILKSTALVTLRPWFFKALKSHCVVSLGLTKASTSSIVIRQFSFLQRGYFFRRFRKVLWCFSSIEHHVVPDDSHRTQSRIIWDGHRIDESGGCGTILECRYKNDVLRIRDRVKQIPIEESMEWQKAQPFGTIGRICCFLPV